MNIVKVSDDVSFDLMDGEEMNRQHPDSFYIPDSATRHSLQPGQIVKLGFVITVDGETLTERMWVIVNGGNKDGYIGILDNDPISTEQIAAGFRVEFLPKNVINIYD